MRAGGPPPTSTGPTRGLRGRRSHVIAQGATLEEFDRLRPLFAPCVTTFVFGDVWPDPPGV